MGADEKECNELCSPAGSASGQKEIDREFYQLKFSICSSIRYHAKRMRFFDNFHNFITASTVITGSSAFVALLSKGDGAAIALWLTAAIAILTSLDLVFSFSKRAITHDNFRKRYADLFKEMQGAELTQSNLKIWLSEKMTVEVEEPTRLKVLGIHCHNEECIAIGHGDDHIYDLGTLRTLCKDWWSFESYKPISLADKKMQLLNN